MQAAQTPARDARPQWFATFTFLDAGCAISSSQMYAILDTISRLWQVIRRGVTHVARVAVLVMVCWGVGVRDGRACVCTSSGVLPTAAELTRDVGKSLNGAFAVFVGEPIAMNSLTIRFRVDAVWKGDLGSEVVMATGTEALPGGVTRINSCDPTFPFEHAYLIFAYGKTTDTMKAHSCSFTGPPSANVLSTLDRLVPRRAPSASVAPRAFVAVLGNVASPGIIEWRDGLTVEEAVSLAGGPVPPVVHVLARLVDPKSSIVRNRVGIPREVLPAPPTALLLPDDELVVSRDFVRK